MKTINLLRGYCGWNQVVDVREILSNNDDLDLTFSEGICFQLAIKKSNVEMLNILIDYYNNHIENLNLGVDEKYSSDLAKYKLREILKDAVNSFDISPEIQEVLDKYLPSNDTNSDNCSDGSNSSDDVNYTKNTLLDSGLCEDNFLSGKYDIVFKSQIKQSLDQKSVKEVDDYLSSAKLDGLIKKIPAESTLYGWKKEGSIKNDDLNKYVTSTSKKSIKNNSLIEKIEEKVESQETKNHNNDCVDTLPGSDAPSCDITNATKFHQLLSSGSDTSSHDECQKTSYQHQDSSSNLREKIGDSSNLDLAND